MGGMIIGIVCGIIGYFVSRHFFFKNEPSEIAKEPSEIMTEPSENEAEPAGKE